MAFLRKSQRKCYSFLLFPPDERLPLQSKVAGFAVPLAWSRAGLGTSSCSGARRLPSESPVLRPHGQGSDPAGATRGEPRGTRLCNASHVPSWCCVLYAGPRRLAERASPLTCHRCPSHPHRMQLPRGRDVWAAGARGQKHWGALGDPGRAPTRWHTRAAATCSELPNRDHAFHRQRRGFQLLGLKAEGLKPEPV